jgi:hypothetical protein
MSKLTPVEKWNNIIAARLLALKISEDFKMLCKSSLISLGRKKRYGSVIEWQTNFEERAVSASYQDWLYGECTLIGNKYGIDTQVVSMSCLIKGFRPKTQYGVAFPIQAPSASINVVTENTDLQILEKLAYESYTKLGIPLIHKTNAGETRITTMQTSDSSHTPDLPLDKTIPILSLYKIRIELPSGYPPDKANVFIKYAIEIDRKLREGLSHKLPKRLRTSKYIAQAEKYKISRKTLERGEIYDIVDDIYGKEEGLKKDTGLDTKRRSNVNVTRYRLKKKLQNPG